METNKVFEQNPKDSSTGIGDIVDKVTQPQENTGASFYCDALFDYNINDAIKTSHPHLVTLVGFSEFGKSTFVASLYHTLMANGNIDGFEFVDSDTYSGFERRAHVRNAAIMSNKRLIRTSSLDGYLLTLLLKNDERTTKLIISDRAGEIYKNLYSDSLEDVKKDKSLIHSPHVVFFIDASVLITSGQDYMDFEDRFFDMLSRFNQAGVFKNRKLLDVFYNKIDKVSNEQQRNEYNINKDKIENRIKSVSHLPINKIFELSSNKLHANKELMDAIEYVVTSGGVNNSNCIKGVDWVNEMLNI